MNNENNAAESGKVIPINPKRENISRPSCALSDAEKNAERVEWMTPLLTGDDSNQTAERVMLLGMALLAGKNGLSAIDHAIETSKGKRKC